MSKKAILSLVLIGILAFGAGLGTFAWFTAEVSSVENTFATGKFELNGSEPLEIALNVNNAQPGVEEDLNTIEIENTGDYNMFIQGDLDFTFEGGSSELTKSRIEETLLVYPLINNNNYNLGWITLKEFKRIISSKELQLNSNQILTFGGKVKLDGETADNDFQSLTLTINGTVYGRQTTDGAQYKK